MSNSKNRLAIIGLGNTLRRDDGIGILTLSALEKSHKLKNVDYLDFGSCSFDLIHRFDSYDKVILVDGIEAGLKAGELKLFALKDAEYLLKQEPVSTHEINLAGLFYLCDQLGVKTEIYVAGIQVEETDFGEGLSGGVKEKLTENTEGVAEYAARLFASADTKKE